MEARDFMNMHSDTTYPTFSGVTASEHELYCRDNEGEGSDSGEEESEDNTYQSFNSENTAVNSEVHGDTLVKSIPCAQPQITDRRKGELIRQNEEEIRKLMEERRRMREIRAEQEREREEQERMAEPGASGHRSQHW